MSDPDPDKLTKIVSGRQKAIHPITKMVELEKYAYNLSISGRY